MTHIGHDPQGRGYNGIPLLTVNFGMVVAIYYFLHGARIPLKAFTFFAYTAGMLVLLGEILVETNIKSGAIEALRSLPSEQLDTFCYGSSVFQFRCCFCSSFSAVATEDWSPQSAIG